MGLLVVINRHSGKCSRGGEEVTDHLVQNPADLDADLMGIGRESAPEPNQGVNRE